MQAAQNDLITRIGPGTPCGALMRRYWQPVALLDEFDPRLFPEMAARPLKAVRLLGQDFILFKDTAGQWGLLIAGGVLVSLLIAALSAEGTSVIHNIHQIDRGYQDIEGRLKAVGARIERVQ